MSTDETTIPFPVNKLKAETLRLVAKDLGVSRGGKKEDLLQRLRAGSESDWVTPVKRKAESASEASPSKNTKRKLRTPKTAPRMTRSASSATKRAPIKPARATRRRSSPKKSGRGVINPPNSQEPSDTEEDKIEAQAEVANNVTAGPHVFDDYLTSGSNDFFITAEHLLAIVGELPATKALPLWKPNNTLAKSSRSPAGNADLWLITALQEGKVENLSAFREAWRDVLEKLGEQEPVKTCWYKAIVSRNSGKGALAVKIIRGTIEDKKAVPLKDANEEEGTFWFNEPIAANQTDSDTLDHVYNLLF